MLNQSVNQPLKTPCESKHY